MSHKRSDLIVDKVIEQLTVLPYELQWRVFEFTRVLAVSIPHGVPGHQLLRFAGAIPLDDLQLMRLAIEEGCERIDANEWQIPVDAGCTRRTLQRNRKPASGGVVDKWLQTHIPRQGPRAGDRPHHSLRFSGGADTRRVCEEGVPGGGAKARSGG